MYWSGKELIIVKCQGARNIPCSTKDYLVMSGMDALKSAFNKLRSVSVDVQNDVGERDWLVLIVEIDLSVHECVCLKELEHRKLGWKVIILKYDLRKSLSKEI